MDKFLKYVSWIGAYIFMSLLFNSSCIMAQDIHFSQYSASILNLNPSLTGFFEGNYRFNTNYRRQWVSVPVPYSSFSCAGDARFKTKNMKSDCVGAGLIFNNDVSGMTQYQTNQLYVSASYIHKLNTDSSLLWTNGLMIGISNIGFNYNKMTFDQQYQNGNYNAANFSGENFHKTNSTYMDFNGGTFLQYNIKSRACVQYGLSYHHFSSPKLSFQNNSNIRIDSKLHNYFNFSYPISEKIDGSAELLIAQQGKYKEFNPGIQIKYWLNLKDNQSVSAGLYLRTKDAIIARLGYQIKTFSTGISYDINRSPFIAATSYRGGIEFYLIYIFKKVAPFIPQKRICPMYM